jgi:subtilase family protein
MSIFTVLAALPIIMTPTFAKVCQPTRVAVIDTGFGFNHAKNDSHLCKTGHRDFSNDQMFSVDGKVIYPIDLMGHGTNVVGLIEQYAAKGDLNYCIVMIKFFSDRQSGTQRQAATTKAIRYATQIGAKFINYSAGGTNYDQEEYLAIENFLNKGGKLISAAGNEHQDLDSLGNTYYPAMYDSRITVVGSLNYFGAVSKFSNFGKLVSFWEVGENAMAYGVMMSGTSQATAIRTGKTLAETHNTCDIGR